MFRRKLADNLKKLSYPLMAIIISLLIGGVFLRFLGFNPISVYSGMVTGSVGNLRTISDSLNKSVPIILTGLSFAIANRCGLINLGAEGQLHIGAMASVLLGAYVKLPIYIHLPLVMIVGFLGGALFGMMVGYLKNRFQANELIVTIMLNYIAASFVAYLIANPLRGQSSQGNFPQSEMVMPSAQMPTLFPGLRLHAGFLVTLFALLFFSIFLWKMSRGYEMRVVGLSKTAGIYAGMDLNKNVILAMILAGGFAGLAGAIELTAVQFRIVDGFTSNFGYDGIAVALLGGGTPIGILLSGILFGTLRVGANKMQVMTSVPSATIQVIQSLIILFVIGKNLLEFAVTKFHGWFSRKFRNHITAEEG